MMPPEEQPTPGAADASTEDDAAWVRAATLRLTGMRGVSPSREEALVADEVLALLTEGGLEGAYTAIGLDPLPGDRWGRRNVFAYLRGQSARTVVLLGHFDTVATTDYGPLEPWALDPAGLAARADQLTESAPGLADDLRAAPDDWLLGRGVVDMKSGVAAIIAVLRHYAQAQRGGRGEPPLSLVLLATPDEENASAGVLQGVRFLLELREREGLDYLGAINTDYTNALYPGDPQRYIYSGTVGKLLPTFLVIGRESHVGEPFQGLDANLLAAELIRDLSMQVDLCDTHAGQRTPPPVTLHATDLKATYDVQLPFAAYFYLNVLTFTTQPGDLLERLRHRAEAALATTVARVAEAARQWSADGHRPQTLDEAAPRDAVLTYAELHAATIARLGADTVAEALARAEEPLAPELDARERCVRLVEALWRLSGRRGPAVVLFYSPPYYPHVAPVSGALDAAVRAVAAAHPEQRLAVRDLYPYISDMSYLRLAADLELDPLIANLPTWREWQEPPASAQPGGYSLPLAAIRQLDLPVVNLGPYGRGAHQRGERLLMSYSFGVLPRLLRETIERLADGSGDESSE